MNDRIENDLARVMRDHEHEAPDAAGLIAAMRADSRRPGRSGRSGSERWRRRYVPLAAAAAVAAVIAGSVWAGSHVTGHRNPSGHPRAMSCPAKYARAAPWVPAQPVGVPGRARLAPRRLPATAVICAYDGRNIGPPAQWALSGRRLLVRGLPALVAELAWQPARIPGQQIPCTLVGGNQVNYLIGLTYHHGGRLWVAATEDPNACVMSSNGEFVSVGVVGGLVTKAFTTGRWPERRPVSCHGISTGTTGRLGQEHAMVPPGSTSVTIFGRGCRTVSSSTPGYQTLVAALNALPTRVSTRGCSMTSGRSGPSYRLLFSYLRGPALQVEIDSSCVPSVDNLGLQAESAGTIVPIIERLLRR